MKVAHRIINICVGALLAISLYGCATGAKMDRKNIADVTAIKAVESSKPIGFYRILFNVPNEKIGAHHDGLARVPQSEHYWSAGQLTGGDQYKTIATEILKQYGYQALGVENALFGQDNSAKAQYQLGATVTAVKYNTYAPLAGNFSESELSVDWQLLDSYSKQIVMTYSTIGYGKTKGMTNSCMLDSFADAFRKMLIGSSLSQILGQDGDDVPSTGASPPEIIEVRNSPTSALELPEDMEKAMSAVVLIKVGQTQGSGVIVSPDGYVLTAEHVVSGTDDALLILRDDKEVNARVVRHDANQDVALLKMEGSDFPVLSVKIGGIPSIGEDVFIIGTPLKLSFTVSKGVVSGVRDNPERNIQWVQTDGAINPGNSGGPMINKHGEVIGIVSWKYTSQEGLSFAAAVTGIEDKLGIHISR